VTDRYNPMEDAAQIVDGLRFLYDRIQSLREDNEALRVGAIKLNGEVDAFRGQSLALQEDVQGLQAANKALGDENAMLRRDSENLNRAAAELRGLVGMGNVKLDGRDREIKRLENKLALVEEQRDGDKQALRIGRLFYQMLKASQLGGRDFIMACQDAVDHANGDDIEPLKPFGERP
jgi:predicted RNase H-like nuclease (RuvC/YqgF family)